MTRMIDPSEIEDVVSDIEGVARCLLAVGAVGSPYRDLCQHLGARLHDHWQILDGLMGLCTRTNKRRCRRPRQASGHILSA
jgi:hypothetical protein